MKIDIDAYSQFRTARNWEFDILPSVSVGRFLHWVNIRIFWLTFGIFIHIETKERIHE